MTDTNEDKLDLEEVKSFRQALEILFDGSGVIDTDEILMKFDDLIQEVEELEAENADLKQKIAEAEEKIWNLFHIGSIVDWYRIENMSDEEVLNELRINGIDPVKSVEKMREIIAEAIKKHKEKQK